MIPWVEYRYQILHHAVVLNVPVIFVAATKHSIIYAARVEFDDTTKHELIETFHVITSMYLEWILHPSITVPNLREQVYGRRMDQESVQNYMNLVISLIQKVEANGPMPAAKYIKPTLLSTWNTNKGGTDVMSRVLRNAPFNMTAISPKANIVWRFVQMGAVNTYYIYQLLNSNPQKYTSYRKWRHQSAHLLTYDQTLKSIFLTLKEKVEDPKTVTTYRDNIPRKKKIHWWLCQLV